SREPGVLRRASTFGEQMDSCGGARPLIDFSVEDEEIGELQTTSRRTGRNLMEPAEQRDEVFGVGSDRVEKMPSGQLRPQGLEQRFDVGDPRLPGELHADDHDPGWWLKYNPQQVYKREL